MEDTSIGKKKIQMNKQTNKTNLDSVMHEMKMIVGEQRKRWEKM